MVAIRGNEKERVGGRILMDKVRGKRSMDIERGGGMEGEGLRENAEKMKES